MKYFDAHTHVHFAAYKEDSDAVIKRALAAEVGLITVGTQKDTSKGAVAAASKYEDVYAAIGLHPVHTDKSFHDAQELGGGDDAKGFTSRGESFDPEYYLELGRDEKVVAIGECGLDYFRIGSNELTTSEGEKEEKIKKQKESFGSQIDVAKALGKPLMIHCRDAFRDLIAMLRERKEDLLPDAGVIHFFTGTKDDAKDLLELGFGFTFGGVVTFTRDYDETLKYLPLENILSETDAPYVAPAPYRGKRNEPAYIVETVKKLAEIKGVSEEEMAASILRNARRIFRIR